MKKVILALMLMMSVVCVGQDESVLLRINYEVGGQYETTMNMSQNMISAGVMMNMNMEMLMDVKEKEEDDYVTHMKFTRVAMDMLQGGQQMSYDSNTKDEDLDEAGKQMKAQMDPMLQIQVKAKQNALGKTFDVVVEPNIPNAVDFTNSSSIEYPEEAVKVGSTWNMEKMNQGMKSLITYTVTKITDVAVFAEISGTMEGVGDATISGDIEIDRASGVPNKSTMKVEMKSGGQDMKVEVNLTMKKI